jgi:hypothetical protein
MPGGFRRSKALWDETRRPHQSLREKIQALLTVVLYEIQPIRFSETDWKLLISIPTGILRGLYAFLKFLPGLARALFHFGKDRKLTLAGVVVYYYAVRWVHRILDAGPIVIICTCLVTIFTIGLNDEEQTNGLSAYSVFNRGFEKLMGSVDTDALLAQHLGLGPGAVLPVGPAEAAAPAPDARNQQQGRIDEPDQNNNEQRPPPNNNNNNQARKSGKKARRRNLEQRREIQRQRDAAVEMGMQGGENQEEMMAMQRLIEGQIENNNN